MSENTEPSREGGYVRIYRRVLYHHAFCSPLHAHIFIHMIMLAAWRDHHARYRGNVIELNRGQLVVGERTLAEDFGVSRKLIARLLEVLRRNQMISLSKSHRYTTITISNYNVYQASAGAEEPLMEPAREPLSNHRGATEEPPKKEENKKKKEKERDKEVENPPTPLLFDHRTPAKPTIARDFEEWWEQVPIKIAKGDAERAYRKARKHADHQTLIRGIMRYAAERIGQERQYTPSPARWLNGRRWLDEARMMIGRDGSAQGRDNAYRHPARGCAEELIAEFESSQRH
jgi:hypothetical protein